MDIPTYRIYNVLKIFSRRLFEEENCKRHPSLPQRLGIHRVSIADDGKRRFITERITAEIFNRLSQSSMSSFGGAGSDPATSSKINITLPIPKEFTYHVIDSHNRKETASMTVEDPSALIERLEYSKTEETDHQGELPGGVEK